MSNTCSYIIMYTVTKHSNICNDVMHLLNGFSEAVEVVLDESLSLKHVLPEKTDKGEEPVDLSEVEHCPVVETNDRGRVLVVGCSVSIFSQSVWRGGHVTYTLTLHCVLCVCVLCVRACVCVCVL